MKRIAAPDRNAASCLFLAAVWCFCHTGLLGMIGRQGLAYAGPAMEMTAIGFAALTLPASLVMDRMIRARYVRKKYASIRCLVRRGMLLSVLTGAVLTLLFFLLSRPLALLLGGEAHMALVIAAISPVFVLMLPMGVMHGYFRGIRMTIPALSTVLLPAILLAIFPIAFGAAARKVGTNVAALLRDESYPFVYGAAGAAAGVVAALVITLIYWMFLLTATYRNRKKNLPAEQQTEPEQASSLLRSFLRETGWISASLLFLALPVLTNYRILHMAVDPKTRAMAGWGAYYGKTLSLVFGTALLLFMPFTRYPQTMIRLMRKEDQSTSRSFFGMTMRLAGYSLFPFSFFYITAARPITAVIGNAADDAGAVSLQISGILVLLSGIALLLGQLYIGLGRTKLLTTACAAAYLIQTALCFATTRQSSPGITVCAIPLTVFYLVLDILLLFFLRDYLLEKNRYFRAYIMLLVSSVAAAIPIYLLSGLLTRETGYLAASLILAILYVLIYLMISLFTGATDLRNFDRLPGGRMIIALADLLGL